MGVVTAVRECAACPHTATDGGRDIPGRPGAARDHSPRNNDTIHSITRARS
jgi:hypothetical protein